MLTLNISWQELLQSVWDGLDSGIFVVDVIHESLDFLYVAFNPAMAIISPMSVESMLGKTLQEVFPGNEGDIYRFYFTQAVRSLLD
jgi:PAS domain-containing protein